MCYLFLTDLHVRSGVRSGRATFHFSSLRQLMALLLFNYVLSCLFLWCQNPISAAMHCNEQSYRSDRVSDLEERRIDFSALKSVLVAWPIFTLVLVNPSSHSSWLTVKVSHFDGSVFTQTGQQVRQCVWFRSVTASVLRLEVSQTIGLFLLFLLAGFSGELYRSMILTHHISIAEPQNELTYR